MCFSIVLLLPFVLLHVLYCDLVHLYLLDSVILIVHVTTSNIYVIAVYIYYCKHPYVPKMPDESD